MAFFKSSNEVNELDNTARVKISCTPSIKEGILELIWDFYDKPLAYDVVEKESTERYLLRFRTTQVDKVKLFNQRVTAYHFKIKQQVN